MTATEIIGILRRNNLRVFTTADIITLSGLTDVTATQHLLRLASQNIIVRIKRGVWVNKLVADLNPYEAVPFLRAPWPAYVSLHSALADYGVVQEIPHVIYGVTSTMPRQYSTAIGDFRFHHLPEHLIWGFEIRQTGLGHYPVADREKAFLDLIYLALTPRSPLQLPHKRGRTWELDKAKLSAYAKRFHYAPLESWLKANSLWIPGARFAVAV
ncbi:MAG: type IV toxin-antitoxin system AbiEi family antitoxin domain-containing protein [Elusimicrobia bacterium]|nr:type IV toxin-antitoxin system AbiEi family antitoxin domain-containing protein [Elusimicrobiota bacterium]